MAGDPGLPISTSINGSTTDRPASDAKPVRRVFIKSFGCQMNVYDSQRMADVAAAEGYQETDERRGRRSHRPQHLSYPRARLREDLLRTRQDSRTERRSRPRGARDDAGGGRLRRAGRRRGDRAPPTGRRHRRRAAELSSPAATARARGAAASGRSTRNFPLEDKFDHLPASAPAAIRARGVSAFVAVQEGCDKFCSFCVVPYTRGGEASRPVAKVFAEIERLARAGVGEITLLGQNVNAYHGRGEGGRSASLADLIAAAAEIPGVLRLRYATSHPERHARRSHPRPSRHRRARALSASADPVRLGSHPVGDEPAPQRARLSRSRRARAPGAPGHRAVLGFHRRLSRRERGRFRGDPRARARGGVRLVLRVQVFRPAGHAGGGDGRLRSTRRRRRSASPTLFGLLEEQRLAFNRRLVGRRFDVVFDRPGRRAGQIIGRSPYMQSVYAEGDLSLIGAMASGRDRRGRPEFADRPACRASVT